MLIPLETAGFSPALSVLSLSGVCTADPDLLVVLNSHLLQHIRKPLARQKCCRQVLAGGGFRVQEGHLWFVGSCQIKRSGLCGFLVFIPALQKGVIFLFDLDAKRVCFLHLSCDFSFQMYS